MEYTVFQMTVFAILVIVALLVDLHAHKADTVISARSAAIWSVFWVLLSLGFAGYVYATHGAHDAELFLAGYFLEKSLSVDNLFVIMAIFTSFSVADKYQHRVLYYGIIGALILRFVFIAAGTGLITLFGPYALTAFGLFVLWSAWKMWQAMGNESEELEDYSQHWAVRLVKRWIPVYPHIENHDFFVHSKEGASSGRSQWQATPLFLCLIAVEVADIMFAFDSVPAVIAITEKPFLVYTSNIFAILGLRSLYFLLAAAKRYLCHLEKAVILILVFIGFKMLLTVVAGVHIPPMLSLSVVFIALIGGIAASFIWPGEEDK